MTRQIDKRKDEQKLIRRRASLLRPDIRERGRGLEKSGRGGAGREKSSSKKSR